MMDERLEHEYCTLLRTIAKRHGARAEFDFTPNNQTEEDVFAVNVTLFLTHRITRLKWTMLGLMCFVGIVGLFTRPSLIWGIHVIVWQFTAMALHWWLENNMRRVAPKQEKIYTEFHREWRRRYPNHMQL
jgi:hypothetical protein